MKTLLFVLIVSISISYSVLAQHADKFFEQPFETSSVQINRSIQSLTPQVFESHLKFLETPFPDKKVSITEEEFHGLKNDIADTLLSQENIPDDFDKRFLAMLDDNSLSNVWHNYIIQKLDKLFERSSDASLKAKMISRLFREGRNPKLTISGTSLMTLLRLEKKLPEVIDENKLSERAQWLTAQDRYPFQDRLSALHVLADLSPEKAFEPARKWLSDEHSHAMLKTAALAVLGKSGSLEDIALVRSFLKHPDLRLRTASKNASINDETFNEGTQVP